MITKPLAKIKAATEAKFSSWFSSGRLRQWGVYNRRPIAGTTTWSQHAWGNAWDIGVPSLADGDKVAAWLRAERAAGRLPIGTILWRVKDHFDHIHVEGKPKKTGTPPIIDKDKEMKEFVEWLQETLNAMGATDKNGDKLKVDGVVGPLTQSALINGFQQGGVATGATVKGTFTGKIN